MIVCMNDDPQVNLLIFQDARRALEDKLDEYNTNWGNQVLAIHENPEIRLLYKAWKTAINGRDKMLEQIYADKLKETE